MSSDKAKDLMQQARQAEIQSSRHMARAPLFEVYRTNADLEQVEVVYQIFHRDMAETQMYNLFKASGYGTDYMLYNRAKMDVVSICLTTHTSQLRGECRQ